MEAVEVAIARFGAVVVTAGVVEVDGVAEVGPGRRVGPAGPRGKAVPIVLLLESKEQPY